MAGSPSASVRPSAHAEVSGSGDGWIDLRAPGGRLLARYDPGRALLEFRRGGDEWLFDLRQLPAPETAVLENVTMPAQKSFDE